jgi:twitching motility protein PilT
MEPNKKYPDTPSAASSNPSGGGRGSGFSPSSELGGRGSSRSASLAQMPQLPAFVQSIIDATPPTLMGLDRILFQSEQLGKVDTENRTNLKLFVDTILERMTMSSASDVDLGGTSTRGLIWYRIDGDKRPDLSNAPFTVDQTNVIILSLLSSRGIADLTEDKSADFSYETPLASGDMQRFRATAYLDMGQMALNMRAISTRPRPLRSLGFHPSIEKGLMFRHVRDGLTLITGVTGSGKSTTLDAVIHANNEDFNGHIVIIGRPIEYIHSSAKCIVRHREVGQDVSTFKDGIVQTLRQDPDMVVIGEMRDPETISAGLEITDSGHKVFSTLHTSSAVESIDRIVAEYPPSEQPRIRIRLADVLRCIVSQKLLPKVGGGRVLAKEVLWVTSPARAAIKNDNSSEIYQMMWEGWNNGQITLEQDLYRLMRQGLITPEVALDHANNKRRFQQLV